MGGSGSASRQWKRVGRWFERFSNTARGRDHDRESDAYQDEAYAFFLNCFHLKDWEEARCVQARDRVHARVDVISGSEGASSALDRSGVNVSCVPPWYLGGEKVPICTQVRFLPGASPALQRAFASRGRADRPRPRKAHLLEPGCHLAMFEAVTTSQWKAKTRICRSIFASSMLAATLSIA